METVKILKKTYDVVQCFEYHMVVQDVDTGAIFIVEYNDLYPVKADQVESNIISLKGWQSCPRKTKTDKKKKNVRN